MFDAAGLAQVARKAMERMAGNTTCHEPNRYTRDHGRALSILRTIHPELSLRQAEALLDTEGLVRAPESTPVP